jgi:hypothetical protein
LTASPRRGRASLLIQGRRNDAGGARGAGEAGDVGRILDDLGGDLLALLRAAEIGAHAFHEGRILQRGHRPVGDHARGQLARLEGRRDGERALHRSAVGEGRRQAAGAVHIGLEGGACSTTRE